MKWTVAGFAALLAVGCGVNETHVYYSGPDYETVSLTPSFALLDGVLDDIEFVDQAAGGSGWIDRYVDSPGCPETTQIFLSAAAENTRVGQTLYIEGISFGLEFGVEHNIARTYELSIQARASIETGATRLSRNAIVRIDVPDDDPFARVWTVKVDYGVDGVVTSQYRLDGDYAADPTLFENDSTPIEPGYLEFREGWMGTAFARDGAERPSF